MFQKSKMSSALILWHCKNLCKLIPTEHHKPKGMCGAWLNHSVDESRFAMSLNITLQRPQIRSMTGGRPVSWLYDGNINISLISDVILPSDIQQLAAACSRVLVPAVEVVAVIFNTDCSCMKSQHSNNNYITTGLSVAVIEAVKSQHSKLYNKSDKKSTNATTNNR